MGFLIAAFRKLSLRRTINNKQYEQMTLNMKLQQIQNNVSIMQQATAESQNAFSSMMGNLSQMNELAYNQKVMSYNNAFNQQQKEYNNIFEQNGSDINNDAVKAAKSKMEQWQAQATKDAQGEYSQYNTYKMSMVAANQVMNSIFTNSDKAKLQQLQQEETRIQQQTASLETQLTLLNEEYGAVTKLEQQEAKNSVAKFGLG